MTGILGRFTKSHKAFTALLIGIVVILWMTFSKNLPDKYAFLRNPMHVNMTIVVGTLVIFLAGLLLTKGKRKAGQFA